MKSANFRVQAVQMSDMNARRNSATKVCAINDGPNASLVDNPTGRGLSATADEHQLPGPAVALIADEVIENMDEDTPKAFNLYRNKKLLSHGLMDVALFSANANQLRYVLGSSDGSVFFIICIMLLLISIFLQILVGVALLLSARYNVTNCDQRKMAFKLGNYVIVGIFLITVVNVFIASFGGPSVTPPTVFTNPATEVPDPIAGSI